MHNKKGEHHVHHVSETHHKSVEDKLVENLIQLQKVHADLAVKFDKLSNQISTLLTLFEASARTIANNPAVGATEKDKAFLDKIDKLLDQNKLIAKGLTLMDGRMRDRLHINTPAPQTQSFQNSPQSMQQSMTQEDTSDESSEMTPSIKGPEVPKPLPKY